MNAHVQSFPIFQPARGQRMLARQLRRELKDVLDRFCHEHPSTTAETCIAVVSDLNTVLRAECLTLDDLDVPRWQHRFRWRRRSHRQS